MSEKINVLAVDLGASHGRVIRGTYDGITIVMETVYDFPNQPVKINDSYFWDHIAMAANVQKGIKEAGPAASVGVDAWGHDYIPVTAGGEIIGQMYSYRDARTDRVAADVAGLLSEEESFYKTGEGINGIATRVQLYALKKEKPETYAAADSIVSVADYINYLLCGVKKVNETQVSMGGMMDIKTRDWSEETLAKLTLKPRWGEIARCGEVLGKTEDGMSVVAVAAHDTASAMAFLPNYRDDHLILSSGTWALVGIKTMDPVMDEETLRGALQVELGSGNELLHINNLTGMWLMQELERDWGKVDYDELNAQAALSDYCETVNSQDASLSKPGNMEEKINVLLKEAGKPLPASHAEYYRCILFSLLKQFTDTIELIERKYSKKYTAIHVVGGGAKNKYFNQLIADATGKTVIAGPYEATAIGNILDQLLGLNIIKSRKEAMEIVSRSFPPEIYQPK